MSVVVHRAELLTDAGAALGEGPAWDGYRLSWVDILAGTVHVADADGVELSVLATGGVLGAALPAEGGGWLLATGDGFAFLGDDGAFLGLLEVHAEQPELRFNDAACDPAGIALAGTMRYDERAGDGVVYRLDAGPVATPLLSGRGLCNGLGWSPDGGTFYFIDSLTGVVAGHPWDRHTSTPGPGCPVVSVAADLGVPDGLCIDDDGCLWVAVYGGGTVHRYHPDGRLLATVAVPTPYTTSCAFGGPRRDRLFVTTAGGPGAEPARRRPEPGSGGLWAVDPGVTGPAATPWHRLEVPSSPVGGPADPPSRPGAYPPPASRPGALSVAAPARDHSRVATGARTPGRRTWPTDSGARHA